MKPFFKLLLGLTDEACFEFVSQAVTPRQIQPLNGGIAWLSRVRLGGTLLLGAFGCLVAASGQAAPSPALSRILAGPDERAVITNFVCRLASWESESRESSKQKTVLLQGTRQADAFVIAELPEPDNEDKPTQPPRVTGRYQTNYWHMEFGRLVEVASDTEMRPDLPGGASIFAGERAISDALNWGIRQLVDGSLSAVSENEFEGDSHFLGKIRGKVLLTANGLPGELEYTFERRPVKIRAVYSYSPGVFQGSYPSEIDLFGSFAGIVERRIANYRFIVGEHGDTRLSRDHFNPDRWMRQWGDPNLAGIVYQDGKAYYRDGPNQLLEVPTAPKRSLFLLNHGRWMFFALIAGVVSLAALAWKHQAAKP
jgi:hypothetical protein